MVTHPYANRARRRATSELNLDTQCPCSRPVNTVRTRRCLLCTVCY